MELRWRIDHPLARTLGGRFHVDRTRDVALGPLQPFGFHRPMDCDPSVERTAMFDTASGWLITSIDPGPMTVSLVQVAVSLPLFLFTLPAGALADVLDSRRLLIAVETAILAVSVIFAGLVSVGLATPTLLLATTFLLGVGGALTSPAWGAIIPMLVPKEDLDGATAAHGAGFNIGRAAGPALGGLVIALAGLSVPFWVFAATNVTIIAALLWWRSPRRGSGSLPAERLVRGAHRGSSRGE
jgi:MFS family permease